MNDTPQHDNRLVVRLRDYWDRIRKDSPMPDYARNNPASIGDLWDKCFVLNVIPPANVSYRYEHVGSKIEAMYGKDVTGMFLDLKNRQFPDAVIIPRLQVMRSLMDLKVPQEDSGQLPLPSGSFVKYRIILLPFGKDSGVTHILVGVSYKEF